VTWAAGSLIVLGALLAFSGSIGLLKLRSFYERVHPPTMGTTLGAGLILIGSMLHFTGLDGRPVVHEVLIGLFMAITTPVTYILLMGAALQRDRSEGRDPLRPDAAASSPSISDDGPPDR
jgi:multicomponent K+:H+ antiporter subunit G